MFLLSKNESLLLFDLSRFKFIKIKPNSSSYLVLSLFLYLYLVIIYPKRTILVISNKIPLL